MKGSLGGFAGVDRSSCAVQRRGVLQRCSPWFLWKFRISADSCFESERFPE
jgi:hypothetical protein